MKASLFFFAAAMQLAATEPVKTYNFQVTLEEADATPCNDEERRLIFNAIERAIQTAGSKFLTQKMPGGKGYITDVNIELPVEILEPERRNLLGFIYVRPSTFSCGWACPVDNRDARRRLPKVGTGSAAATQYTPTIQDFAVAMNEQLNGAIDKAINKFTGSACRDTQGWWDASIEFV